MAVYGSLEITPPPGRFRGPGPVYVLYADERSRLALRDGDQSLVELTVADSMVCARATLTYYYKPRRLQ